MRVQLYESGMPKASPNMVHIQVRLRPSFDKLRARIDPICQPHLPLLLQSLRNEATPPFKVKKVTHQQHFKPTLSAAKSHRAGNYEYQISN